MTATDGTPLGVRERVARRLVRTLVRPTLDGTLPIPLARRWQELLGGAVPNVRRRVVIRSDRFRGVPVEVVRARGAALDTHLLLYVHGGGFYLGSPRTYRPVTAALAHAAQATVIVPDYRLAPEHPYPAAIDDVRAVFAELVGRTPHRLTVAGDSAGGNLALCLALAVRDAGERPADAVGLMSPFVDLTEPEGSRDLADDAVLTRRGPSAAELYLGDTLARDDPRVSPAFAKLHDLPPILLQVGGAEALYDDAVALAVAAARQQVDLNVQVWPGMWHVHQAFAPILNAGQHALEDLGAFLATGAPPHDALPAGDFAA